jgi:hypothetical protein
LNPVGHSVDQLFTVLAAVKDHERLYSSTYNRAGVFLFHDFSKKKGRSNDFLGVALPANNLYQRAWARQKSTPLNCSSKKDVDLPERSGRKQSAYGIGRLNGLRHLEVEAFPTRNVSRPSAKADQFQDGVRRIYQWWRRSDHYHPKHHRFEGKMLGRFLYQIILADPVEQQLATANVIEL